MDTRGPDGNVPLSWPYSLNRKQRRAQKKAARYANAKGGFKSREETPKDGQAICAPLVR